MVATAFLHVAAPSWVLFLLLATTTRTLLPLADGATSSATGDDVAAGTCATELAACTDVDTCVTCLSSLTEKETEINACGLALGLDFSVDDVSLCEGLDPFACCVEDVTDDECFDNDAFVDYWFCFAETNGCLEDEITCADGLENAAVAEENGATTVASVGSIVSIAGFVGVTCASTIILLQLLSV